MATLARRQTAEERPFPKRTRSLAFKFISDTTNAAVGALTGRKQHNDPTLDRSPRPVLLPIHTNIRPLRRHPRMGVPRVGSHSARSGSYSASTGSQSPGVVDNVPLSAGKKRKRGGNENYDGAGLASYSGGRGKGSLKRSKSAYATLAVATSSTMDVDEFGISSHQTPARRSQSQHEVADEDTELEDAVDSSDDHYISSAPPWQLQKLRKEDLVRLYTVADLGTADEDLTKSDIVNALVQARKHSKASSSPRTGSARSPASSHTDGNDAGAEESDAPSEDLSRKKKLRRSATTHAQLGLGHPTTRLASSKSMNLSSGNERRGSAEGSSNRRTRFASELKRSQPYEARRRSAQQVASSSPGPSADDVFTSRTVPGVRTRLRQSSRAILSNDPKGKGKHVEFSDEAADTTEESRGESSDEWVDENTPTKRRAVDVDATPVAVKRSKSVRDLSRSTSKRSVFSPKKLRPRGSRQNIHSVTNISNVADSGSPAERGLRRTSSRRTWARKAKRGESMREPSSSDDSRDFAEGEDQENLPEEDVDELMEEDVSTQVPANPEEESDLTELSEEDQPSQPRADDDSSELTEEEDEDDDFGEQAEESPVEETPRPTRTRSSRKLVAAELSPVQRSASRRRSKKTSAGSKRSSRNRRVANVPEQEEVDDAVDEEPEEQPEGEETGAEDADAAEPKVLRNGKVIGEVADDDEEEVDQIEEDAESIADAIEGDDGEDAEEREADPEEEEVEEEEEVDAIQEDDDLEDDFDLAEATAKSLTRLRRDDLVKLCETRYLEAEGTKVQLVNSLLEWRDAQATAPSSSTQPSSNASTVRAPSTYRPPQNGSPVLLRNDRVHVLQPRTPDPDPDAPSIHLIGSKARDKEREPDELELDLESLGLEDREIPAEKLTKLEKIGSGGFKDVYIGKYKNRKVAIAEFRGHLGPMDIKELKLLADFNHENVVRFLGVSIPEDTRNTPVMMVSELCTNGDLFDYVRNVPPPPLKKVLRLMLDIANGINYLHNIHKPSVIHRDCKSSNILITSKVSAKIADFGLAKVKQSTRSMVKSLVGTVNWQAPELWHAHPKYDHKVDVFSCAMVFWEILQWHNPTKKYPWEGMNEHAIYEEVGAKKHRPSITGLRKLWCPAVVDLMERMWRQDPKERPPISEVVEDLETIIADL